MEDTNQKTPVEPTEPTPATEQATVSVEAFNQMKQTLDLLTTAVKDDAKYNALKNEIIGIRDLLTARAQAEPPAPAPSKFKPPAPDPNKW